MQETHKNYKLKLEGPIILDDSSLFDNYLTQLEWRKLLTISNMPAHLIDRVYPLKYIPYMWKIKINENRD